MKLLKLITNRAVLAIILIIVQLAVFIGLVLYVKEGYRSVSIALEIMSILVLLFVINKRENAAYQLGWVILILTLPVFGTLFYIINGNKRASKNLAQKIAANQEATKRLAYQSQQTNSALQAEDERFYQLTQYLVLFAGFPVYRNATMQYYPLGEDMFSAMLIDLKKAQKYIYLEYFIIDRGEMWSEILDVLKQKVAAGLDVRLIYDDVGCLFKLPRNYHHTLRELGIKTVVFNKLTPSVFLGANNRNHRKIMVIDGEVAYNGGMNIADEYINRIEPFGHWKDTGVRMTGTAVYSFYRMFLEMWHACAEQSYPNLVDCQFTLAETAAGQGYIQPFTDSPLDDETVGKNIYIEILNQAVDYVYIYTPYLIINYEMQSAICLAAKRGVDVRIITPGIADKKTVYMMTRSHYDVLIEAGVKIYEYSPGFLHAKSYLADDKIAVVGTVNMDYRSLFLHFECGTLFYKTAAIAQLKKDMRETMNISRTVQYGTFNKSIILRLINAVLKVFAPLM